LEDYLNRIFSITQFNFNSHGESPNSYTTIDVDAQESSVRLIKAMQLSNFGANQTDAPVSLLLSAHGSIFHALLASTHAT
jgi:hypothetical protein